MSVKLKALGLGLLVTLTMGAVTVMNASATSSGHFTSDSPSGKTIVVGAHNVVHFTEFTSHGLAGGSVCDEIAYQGTAGVSTTTEITIVPSYQKCHTTEAPQGNSTITVNGCYYLFTSGGTGTVHVACPENKSIEVHHPNCTIKITPQTVGGITYGTVIDPNGKHIFTLGFNAVQVNTEYEGGICVFTGTNHTATLGGSLTVRGFEDKAGGPQVNITAT